MATPKPGEIRCPTCHRSTPPAAFCTQCGSAIPTDARIRPRGLDRDELQERIRARRSGGEPYRRGAAPVDGPAGYERFEPEPEDAAARRADASDAPRRDLLTEEPSRVERRDVTRERDDWAPAPSPAQERIRGTPVAAPPLAAVDDFRRPEDEYGRFDDAHRQPGTSYEDDLAPGPAAYEEPISIQEYEEWEEEPRERRSSGAGALAILGFLALGVLALLGGAVLAGVFSDDPQSGQLSTSPSPSATAAVESIEPETPEPSVSEVEAPTAEPRQSGDPIVFPDGFTAEVQPCLPGSSTLDGCESNASVNGGALEIWVGFRNGTEDDVIGVEIVAPDGSSLTNASLPLADIGCSPTCPRGWSYFQFAQLSPGTYQVLVTRNSEAAGETSFVVS